MGISTRERDREARERAERIRRRTIARSMSGASKRLGERLQRMEALARELDKRLARHAEERRKWHSAWDDLVEEHP